MFKRKEKYDTMGNLDRFFDIVDQSLLVFEEGVKNYLHRDVSALNGNLQNIVKLENEASLLRREIEMSLYSQTTSPALRSDILRLLERLGHIIDALNNDLFQFEIERPNIPSELNGDFLKLMELSAQSVANTLPASRAFFKSPDTAPDKVRRVYFYQREADRQAKALKRKVFHEMNFLKLSEKVHLRYFALHIEELALEAMKVADHISVMSIRSRADHKGLESKYIPVIISVTALAAAVISAFVRIPDTGAGNLDRLRLTLFIFAAVAAVLFVLLVMQSLRSNRYKRTSDNRLLAQEDEINTNNRKLSEMEAQIIKMENDHLQNLLDLKRKETTGVIEKMTEQKDFIDSIYDTLHKAELAQDNETRESLLHEVRTQLSLRKNFTGVQEDIYAKVEQLHSDFTIRLSSKYPNLTQQEKKLATLLRLEFSTKYIAALLNISPKSVEVERHRLRSKLGLERGENLTEFIRNI